VLPMAGFYRMAAEAAGVRPPATNVPMAVARSAARLSEAVSRLTRRSSLLSRAGLDLAAIDLVVDSTKARTELGWNPAPFEERLREVVDWYVDRYRDRRVPLPIKPGGGSP
jgi:dihydroflavonol-4-reductase